MPTLVFERRILGSKIQSIMYCTVGKEKKKVQRLGVPIGFSCLQFSVRAGRKPVETALLKYVRQLLLGSVDRLY